MKDKVYSSKVIWSFFDQYEQNTVYILKKTFTQAVNLNGQKMTVNNKNIDINDKITAIELTKSNKNKDLKFHGGGSIELTDNLN
ncbi:hypothetical protein J4W23_24850, partial [Escherichia coli]